MTTQRMYSLVGCLVLALLVVLGTGCCGDHTTKKSHAIETDNQVPEMAVMEGITYAEDDAETICDEPTGEEYEGTMPMGYREPGYSDTAETGMVTDDESCEATTTSMRCYDEEQSSTEVMEERGMVDDDESVYQDEALTPAVTEEEDISAENSDEWNEENVARDETGADSAVMEEETSTVADNTDEGYSETVAPYIGSEDETPTDPNLNDMSSDTGDTSSEVPADDSGDNPDSGPSS